MYTIGIIASIILVVYLAWHFRHAGPQSVDSIVDSWTADVKNLEAIAEAKIKEVAHYDELKTLAETELNKAKSFADKLKGLFG